MGRMRKRVRVVSNVLVGRIFEATELITPLKAADGSAVSHHGEIRESNCIRFSAEFWSAPALRRFVGTI